MKTRGCLAIFLGERESLMITPANTIPTRPSPSKSFELILHIPSPP